MTKNSTVSNISFTVLTRFGNRFVSFARGFIVARLLDPSMYGYFSGLSLIFLYNSQAHLGILHGLNRSLSISKGQKNTHSLEETKNAGITAIAFLALLFGGLVFSYSFVASEKYSAPLIWGIRIYGIMSVLFHIEYVYHSLLRVDYRFKEINLSKVVFTFSNLIFVIIFALIWGYYGVLVAFFLALVIEIIYLAKVGKFQIGFSLKKKTVVYLIKIGAPISFVYLFDVIFNTIDRLMIARYLSPAELGFYGIGLTFSSELLFRLIDSVSYVIYPKILEKYGEKNDLSSLKEIFYKSTMAIACLLSIAICILFVSVNYLLFYLLPSYLPAVLVTKILIFSVYFLSINQIAVRIIFASGRPNILIVFQICAIIVNILANYLLIKNGMGIKGVALASALSYFLYSACVTHYTLEKLYNNVFTAIKEQFMLYVPLIYGVFLLICAQYFSSSIQPVTGQLARDSIYIIIVNVLLLTCFAPLIIYCLKKLKAKEFFVSRRF